MAKQILSIQRQLRERVWAAAPREVGDGDAGTPTPPCIPSTAARWAGRKSYNPKNKGKRSYQPILTFLAETREYLMGGLRNGDRPTGRQIAAHLESAFRTLPGGVKKILARADSGFYCWEAVEAYEKAACQFVIVARKNAGAWSSACSKQNGNPPPAPTRTRNANSSTNRKAGRGPAVSWRCVTKNEPKAGAAEQYQLFAASAYTYRVFVTNLAEPIAAVVWFLQSARRSREPDQGGQQRRRAGGPIPRAALT